MNLKRMQKLLFFLPLMIFGFLVGGVLLFDKTKVDFFFYAGLTLAIVSAGVVFYLQKKYWRCPNCGKALPGRRNHLVTECPHCKTKLGLEPIGRDLWAMK